jgi:hypothetical protein
VNTMTHDEAVRVLRDMLDCTPNMRQNDEAALRYVLAALSPPPSDAPGEGKLTRENAERARVLVNRMGDEYRASRLTPDDGNCSEPGGAFPAPAPLDTIERGFDSIPVIPSPAEQGAREDGEAKLTEAGVFKGAHGLRGLLNARDFWDRQPYGTRLYYGDGGADYLHRDVLRAAVELLDKPASAPLAAGRVGVGESRWAAAQAWFAEIDASTTMPATSHPECEYGVKLVGEEQMREGRAIFAGALAGPVVAGEVADRWEVAAMSGFEVWKELDPKHGLTHTDVSDVLDALARVARRPLVYADTARGTK